MRITDSDVYIAGGYISMKQMWKKHVSTCGRGYLVNGGFEFSDKVLDGVEVIGNYLGLKKGGVYVTSSYRPKTSRGDCNDKVGGASNSQHITGNAIDIQFRGNTLSNSECLDEIWDSPGGLMCKGQLFQELKAVGIKGIGAYSSFIHIDDGQNPMKIRNSMQGWDKSRGNGWSTYYINRTDNYKCGMAHRDTTGLEDFVSHLTDPEDGYKSPKAKAFEIAAISTLAMAVVGLSIYYIIKRKRR